MLLLSEGGFNTVTVGATPLSSVDVNVKVFLVATVTVCVVVGRPNNFRRVIIRRSAILKTKSNGIYDFTFPLSVQIFYHHHGYPKVARIICIILAASVVIEHYF